MQSLDIGEIWDSAAHERNSRRADRGSGPECLVCGRAIKDESKALWVWLHEGGETIVDTEMGEHLNASGHGNEDCGGQPIGPECRRKHRAVLAPFTGGIESITG